MLNLTLCSFHLKIIPIYFVFAKFESIKASLLSYRKTFRRSTKERQKTQTWVDFCNMPTVGQFKDAKQNIINYVEAVIAKSKKRSFLMTAEFNNLMKSLVALIIFRNACRVCSVIYIMHEHYQQLSRTSVEEDYSMPLAPAQLHQNLEELVALYRETLVSFE